MHGVASVGASLDTEVIRIRVYEDPHKNCMNYRILGGSYTNIQSLDFKKGD